MAEDRVLLSELLVLLLIYAGPVYLFASIVQIAVLAEAGLGKRGIATSVVVSLLLALPLSLTLWWLLGLFPPSTFSWLEHLFRWISPMWSFGGVIFLPALLASVIAYTLVARFALRRVSRPAEGGQEMKRILIALVLGLMGLSGTARADTNFSKVDARDGYFRTSDGVRLHYYEAGKGDPIVFVPGWTVPAWMWEPQIRHFAKTNHVIALDPRSQGASDRPTEGHYPERRAKDIKELVEAKRLGRVILVGHSLAVTEELAYAEQFGTSTLAGLVLVDQGFGPYDADPQMVGAIRAIGSNRRAFLDQLGGWFFKKPTPPGYQKQLFDACMKTPSNSAVALIASRFGMDFRPTVTKLDIPVLFVAQPQFREAGDWLKKNLASARVEVFEDAGHCVFIDDADRFNAVLDEFSRGAFGAHATVSD